MGVPIGAGQLGLEGGVGFTDGTTSYGAGLTVNLDPVTAGVSYALSDIEDIDPNGHTFSGQLGVELPVSGASICPVVGIGYFRIAESVSTVTGSVTQIAIPVGLGVGHTFTAEASDFGVTLFAVPQFLYLRNRVELSGGGTSVAQTDSQTEFAMVYGRTLRCGRRVLRRFCLVHHD